MRVGNASRNGGLKKSGPLHAMSRPYAARSGSGRRMSRSPRRRRPSIESAAPVGGRDEDDATDFGPRVEEQRAAEQIAVLRLALELVEGLRGERIPEA